MEKTKIDKMVERFLSWKLPVDFLPDGGVKFSRRYKDGIFIKNLELNPEDPSWPIGTNLFTANQARAMIEHMMDEDKEEGTVTFEQWWNTSKYTQVVYSDSSVKQVAVDAWNAAVASENVLSKQCRQCDLGMPLEYHAGYGWYHSNSDGGPDQECKRLDGVGNTEDEEETK